VQGCDYDSGTKVKLAALFSAALFVECEVRRKKFYSQISKKQVGFFTGNERDSIFHHY